MRPRSILRPLLLVLMAALPACHTTRKKDEVVVTAPQVPAVPAIVETVVGRASVISVDNAFLVFQLEPGESAAIGEELAIRFAGANVGKVKVTPPIQKRFVTADIVQGTAEKGYEIVRSSGGSPVPP